MKSLVTYFSLSGNTKKIALAILEELESEGHQVQLEDVSEITLDTFNGFDLVFLGSACHDADLAEPVIKILGELPVPTTFKMAGFVTHATAMPDGGKRNEELYHQWAGKCEETFKRLSVEKEIPFLGYFHCQGIPTPPIADFIRKEIIPDEDEWEKYYSELVNHPNFEDFEKAKQFARLSLSMARKSN